MIEIILLLACCCFIFIVVLAGWFLTRGEEGDECEGKDDNGNYEIDEELDCVLKSCGSGYYKSGKECLVDNSGVACVPIGTPDPQGTYLTTKIGGCELSSCKTGYVVDGTTCNPVPPADPCAGLVDDSLASSIPAKCLQKIFKDQGCTEQGTMYPADDYEGWWTQSPNGTTRVYCDSAGTPCGAGNYADTKADIIAWSTMTDDLHVAGCGRATDPTAVVPPSEYKYVGDGGCDNDATKVGNACRGNVECDYIGQQSDGCWHLLDSTGTGKGIASYPKQILPITPVSTTYKYVTGGPCSGAGDYQAVGVTCGDTPGCDTIGVQTNGCWHLLDSTGTGSGIGTYQNGIMSVE